MILARYCVPAAFREPGALWQNEFNRAFGHLSGSTARQDPRGPALNAWEQDETLFIEAELPGYTLEQLDLSVLGNELSIRAEERQVEVGVKYHRQERGTASFQRVLRLPYEVDASQVEAKLQSGVLSIRLPKAASARPKKIQVVTH